MKTIQEEWNNDALKWDNYAKDPENFYTRRAGLAVELIVRHLTEGRSLDIGCGSGFLSLKLFEYGFDVHGTDFAKNMIANSIGRLSKSVEKKKELENKFLVCENQSLPFKKGFFQLVIMMGVLNYLPDQKAYLEYVSEYLRTGGYLLISSTNRLSLFVYWNALKEGLTLNFKAVLNLVRTGTWSGGGVDYRKAEQVYSAGKLTGMVLSCGYRKIDEFSMYSLPFLDRRPLGRSFVGRWLAKYLGWNNIVLYKKDNS